MASGGASALSLQGARSKGSIPGKRTKILQATWREKKRQVDQKIKDCRKSRKNSFKIPCTQHPTSAIISSQKSGFIFTATLLLNSLDYFEDNHRYSNKELFKKKKPIITIPLLQLKNEQFLIQVSYPCSSHSNCLIICYSFIQFRVQPECTHCMRFIGFLSFFKLKSSPSHSFFVIYC